MPLQDDIDFINGLTTAQATMPEPAPVTPTLEEDAAFIQSLPVPPEAPPQTTTEPSLAEDSTFINILNKRAAQMQPPASPTSAATQAYIQGVKPLQPTITPAETFAASALRETPPAIAGIIAGGQAAKWTPGPWYAKAGAGLAAGGLAAYLTGKGEQAVMPEEMKAAFADIEAENPNAARYGALAAQAIGMRPSRAIVNNTSKFLGLLGGALRAGERVSEYAASKGVPVAVMAEQAQAAVNVAFGAGTGLALEAARQIQEGKMDLAHLASATIVGAGLHKGWGPFAKLAGISEASARQLGEVAKRAMGPELTEKFKIDPERFTEDVAATVEQKAAEAAQRPPPLPEQPPTAEAPELKQAGQEPPPAQETPNAIQEGRAEQVPQPVGPEVQQEAGGLVLRNEGIPEGTVQAPPQAEGQGKVAARDAITAMRQAIEDPTAENLRRVMHAEHDETLPETVRRVAAAVKLQLFRKVTGGKPLSAKTLGDVTGLYNLEAAIKNVTSPAGAKTAPAPKPTEPPAAAPVPEDVAATVTVPDALHAGTTVRPPKGATFARVTTEDGKSSVVSTRDLDTLAGAGPYQNVEFGIRDRKGGFMPVSEEGRVAPTSQTAPKNPVTGEPLNPAPGERLPPEDITRQSEQKRKGGFLSLSGNRISPQMQQTIKTIWRDRIVRQFQNREQALGDPKLAAIARAYHGEQGAIKVQSSIDAVRWGRARKEMETAAGKTPEAAEQVNQDLQDVMDGHVEPDALAKKYGINPKGDAIQTLKDYREGASLGKQLAEQLRIGGAKDDLVTKVETNDFYASRALRMILLGKAYRPKPGDYEAAVQLVKTEIHEDFATLSERATEVGKGIKRPKVDMHAFMSGNEKVVEAMKATMSESRYNEAMTLRNEYQRLHDLMGSSGTTGEDVVVSGNAAAIQDAAKSAVNAFLSKGEARARGTEGGTPDIGNLMRRSLEGVMLKLAGPVTDPTKVAPLTRENQARLLTTLATWNKIAAEGEGKWWSNQRMDGRGHSVQLGSDRRMFGNMAEKWVSPALRDEFLGRGKAPALLRYYYDAKGTTRLLHLYGFRTIVERNYANNLNFALQSGDYAKPGYVDALKDAHKLLWGLAKGDINAKMKLKEYIRDGVFDPNQNSMLTDITQMLETSPTTMWRRGMQKLGSMYNYIDFPWKIAAFETALKNNGGDRAAAQDHVATFYQRPDRVPEIGRTMSKLPLADFPGYFIDSTRITVNALKHAVAESEKGNMLPLLGFVIARGLQIGVVTGTEELIRKGVNEVKKWYGDGKEQRTLNNAEHKGVRSLLPSYFRNAMTDTWVETNPQTGEKEVKYAIYSGVSPFSADDLLAGAWQASQGDFKQFAKNVGTELAQKFTPGMFERSVFNLLSGYDVSTGFQKGGLAQLLPTAKVDWQKSKNAWDAVLKFGIDQWMGQAGTPMKQLAQVEKEVAAGVEPSAASYKARRATPGDLAMNQIEPVRVYTLDPQTMAANVQRAIFETAGTAFKTDIQIIRKAYNDVRLQGAITSDQQADAIAAGRDRFERLGALATLMKNIMPVASLNISEEEVRATLRDTLHLSKNEVDAVMDGDVSGLEELNPPKKPSQTEREKLMTGKIGGGRLFHR